MVSIDESIPGTQPLNFETKILLVSLAVGLLADLLLWEGGLIGPGFLVWLTLFSAAGLWLKYQADGAWSIALATWSAVAITAASLLVFRTTVLLILLLWLVIIISAAMVFLQLACRNLRESTVADFLFSQLRVFVHAFVGMFSVVRKVDLRFGLSKPRLWAIIRGALIVTPLIVIFASLFASADAVFSAYAQNLTRLFSPELPRHFFMILLFAWAATGLLAAVCINPEPWKFGQKMTFRLGAEETAVIMGALLILFATFVLLQLSYLFGGREFIEATSRLTLAEHARRGFFELVTVAALTLAVLIGLATTCDGQRLFRPLALALVACVLLILLSAVQRMVLYVDSFGLSIDRFTVLTFLGWLGFGLIMFCCTVLRGRVKDFVISLAVVGIAMVFLFALVNPAAAVARFNIERSISENKEVDALYLVRLGSDAVPVIMENFNELRISRLSQCAVATELLYRLPEYGFGISKLDDWRSWNASKAVAQKAVIGKEAELRTMAEQCNQIF